MQNPYNFNRILVNFNFQMLYRNLTGNSRGPSGFFFNRLPKPRNKMKKTIQP